MSKWEICREKREETDPFEVPMYEVGAMEVLETMSRLVQLLLPFSKGSGEERSHVPVPVCLRDDI